MKKLTLFFGKMKKKIALLLIVPLPHHSKKKFWKSNFNDRDRSISDNCLNCANLTKKTEI